MAMAMVHCDVVMLMSTEGNDGDTLGSDTVLVYDTSDFPAHVVAWLWEGKGDLWCWPIGDQSSKISLVKTKDSPCTCSFRKRWWVWSTKHCWKNIKEELAVVSSLRISSPQKHSHPVWLRLRNIINFTMICWIAMVTHTMPFASMHRLPSALEISPLGHLLSAKASRRLQSLLPTKQFEASKWGSVCVCAFSVTKTVVQSWTIAWELHRQSIGNTQAVAIEQTFRQWNDRTDSLPKWNDAVNIISRCQKSVTPRYGTILWWRTRILLLT